MKISEVKRSHQYRINRMTTANTAITNISNATWRPECDSATAWNKRQLRSSIQIDAVFETAITLDASDSHRLRELSDDFIGQLFVD